MKGPMNREQLMARAPSVFAERKASTRSEKYRFYPTIEIVERLAMAGWMPVQASQQRVRTEERQGFQKHMIRFRKYDGVTPTLVVGDSLVEMVLINSHDGSSSYVLQGGLFRLVCTNGLVVPESLFESIKLKHQGFEPGDVLEASYRVIDEVPRIRDSVDAMRETELTHSEQSLFAESALSLKYESGAAPINAAQVLAPRRYDDNRGDLWTTFNRVQENMIKGGLRGRTANLRRTSTRAVKGIDENVKLNKALWALAEGMKELKEGKRVA